MWTFNIILTRAGLPEAVPYFCMRCRNRLFHINRDILVVWQGDGTIQGTGIDLEQLLSGTGDRDWRSM